MGAQGRMGSQKRPKTTHAHRQEAHTHKYKYGVRAGRAYGTRRTYTPAYKALVLAG